MWPKQITARQQNHTLIRGGDGYFSDAPLDLWAAGLRVDAGLELRVGMYDPIGHFV